MNSSVCDSLVPKKSQKVSVFFRSVNRLLVVAINLRNVSLNLVLTVGIFRRSTKPDRSLRNGIRAAIRRGVMPTCGASWNRRTSKAGHVDPCWPAERPKQDLTST